MAENRGQEIERVVAELLQLPIDARRRVLASKGLEPDIERAIVARLDAGLASTAFLGTPLSQSSTGPERLIGEIYGVWRLRLVLGSGGMGTVYLAERDDEQFSMRAAVKLMASGLIQESAQRRFFDERQILAKLEHPNIARLIDGGISSSGTPFLVMEFIEGVAINDWCEQRKLARAERFDLFRQVCAAVQYAHQNLVIHCDLKPSNILVTPDAHVKLLDFGIARILDAQPDQTLTSPLRMTVNYASPEQVRGVPVSTASDIYSLGILLHELITGRRPYEAHGRPLDEMLEIICRTDARPATGSADLDAIIARALRKEPGERYVSAAELWADIQRYLDGRPVEAQRPTVAYLVRRFAGRHRIVVAFVASIVLLAAISGFLIVRESRAATRRFNSVRKLANFVAFDMHDAIAPLPGSTHARQLLVAQGLRYLDELAADAPSDPALQLELATAYIRLGDVSGLNTDANLGDTAGALRSYAKALALLEPLRRRNPRDAAVLNTLVRALENSAAVEMNEHPVEAMRIADQLVALAQARRGTGSELAAAYNMRAGAGDMLGRSEQALRDGLAALNLWEKLLANEPGNRKWQRNVALGHKYTAGRLMAAKQDPEATERHLRRAEELDAKLVAADPANRDASMDLSFDFSQDAFFQWRRRQRPEAAAPLYERALAIRLELARTDPNDVRLRGRIVYLRSSLANVYLELRRLKQAGEHIRGAVFVDQLELARTDSDRARLQLASDLLLAGKILQAGGARVEACSDWRQAASLLRASAGSKEQGARLKDADTLLAACPAR